MAHQNDFEVEVQTVKDLQPGKRGQIRVTGHSRAGVLAQGLVEVSVKTKNESHFLIDGDTKFRFAVT